MDLTTLERLPLWVNGRAFSPSTTRYGEVTNPATGEVIRCFMVPRESVAIAGGTAKADTSFDLEANCGDVTYGILSNKYLDAKAKTKKYTCTVTVNGDTWSYDETTSYTHAIGGDIAHTDRNTLRRVG